MTYRMLATASQTLWAMIREKYALGPGIEYDNRSGVLFRRLPPASNGTTGESALEETVEVARNGQESAPPHAAPAKRRRKRKGK
jgi:hypothetical protein